MKRLFFVLLCGFMLSLSGYAQSSLYTPPFAKDKLYVSASFSGLDLNYNSTEKWHLGLDARGGWLFEDNWMVLGTVGIDTRYESYDTFSLGAGARYYIEQNGLYIGAGATYVHLLGIDDFRPNLQLGYAFFLNGNVTLEPELYYNQSFKNHSEFSGLGFRLGIGIYFDNLF